jgi:hypothetical protein
MAYISYELKALLFVGLLVFAVIGPWRWLEMPGNAASGCATANFAAIVTPNISNTLNSVTVGDLNGDGKPDLVTTSYFEDKISILIGDGTGQFTLSSTITTVSRPKALALGDFNQDGKLDLAVTRDFSTIVSILLGTGTGTFSAPTNFTVGNNPLVLVLADFNNDGKLDLATGNDGSNTISILLGNGAGGFSSSPTVTGIRATSIVAADFNGDGKADLAAANDANSKVSVVFGDGSGGFGPVNNFDGGSDVQAIAAADFNGDGHADIAVTNFSHSGAPDSVAILLGDGVGLFGAPTKFSVPAGPLAIAVADFNGDGLMDVATANIQQSSSNIAVLLGNGAGALGAATNFNVGTAPNAIVARDVNLDGVPDLVVTSPPNVAALLNACGGAPTPTPTPTPVPSPTPTPVPTPRPGDVVISQIYAGAGNSDSSYQGNYVELFNRTDSDINISGWPIYFTTSTGTFQSFIGFVNSRGLFIAAHGYILIKFGPTGISGQPLSPDLDASSGPSFSIPSAGKVFLARNINLIGSSCPLPNPDIIDFVGYGTTANCFEGSGPTATLSNTTAAIRKSGGCTDTDNNANDFSVSPPNPRNASSPFNSCGGTIQFSSASYTVSETGPRVDITLTRSGDTTSSAAVNYATNDGAALTNCNVINGIASPRCDYINTLGTATWPAGDATPKSFSIAIVDDSYAEGSESFTIGLNSPSGTTLGTQSTATVTITDNETVNGPNPIDNTNFFVRQQYIDFLGREPDSFGFPIWVSTINNCAPGDTSCDRIHVSQQFFQSTEFQERGYFVYRFYNVAFGRKPDYGEFVPDLASVSGFLDATQLEAAKVAFIAGFMARPAFANIYNPLTNQQYVDMLLNTAGVTLASRQSMIDGLNNSSLTRAQVLRQIVESTEVANKYNHQAYAVMEYFGYLRRQPDSFYLDWIAELDRTNNPRGMVTGFVTSQEYRSRFGP